MHHHLILHPTPHTLRHQASQRSAPPESTPDVFTLLPVQTQNRPTHASPGKHTPFPLSRMCTGNLDSQLENSQDCWLDRLALPHCLVEKSQVAQYRIVMVSNYSQGTNPVNFRYKPRQLFRTKAPRGTK